MAVYKTTEQASRLDTIVFNHYGDLSMFDEVLAANPHITTTVIKQGVEIELPPVIVKEVEETLW